VIFSRRIYQRKFVVKLNIKPHANQPQKLYKGNFCGWLRTFEL